jgi:hypothetical protein
LKRRRSKIKLPISSDCLTYRANIALAADS